ncbi:uncharacterized protein LOC115402422 isoform X5 [Salarias fasciatus]|uniref:uncharacterized protein LOC115402422 isoform X5 n=1 Tax=Salarias fasciatus TaxID=181472 RepID=UPI001176F47A|nr:uncharacterized protein LOC115402422 isoform X5 [Salarias fasciatus]
MEDHNQLIRSEAEDEAPASWRKFFVILTGKTNEAHQSVVEFFGSLGQTEAASSEDADYCLVFCPISSRVGTDVRDAMEHLPDGKAAVLVVMHHTFNTEQVIPPSRRLVTDQRVQLTLDCLFYQNKLLSCELNGNMEKNIKKFFRFSQLENNDGEDPDRGGEPGSKDQQKKTPRPPEDGNKKRSNKETCQQDGQKTGLLWNSFRFFSSNKNKTSENDNSNSKAATCSSEETFSPTAPSESDVNLLQKELHKEMGALKKQNAEEMEALKKQNAEEMGALKKQNAEEMEALKKQNAEEMEALKKQNAEEMEALKKQNAEEMEALKKQNAEEIEALKKQNSEETEALNKRNVEEMEALKSETDEEIANRDQKNQELWTDIEKEKKNVGFPVELHPNGPVLTNSGGGPGSISYQTTPSKCEDGAMNSSSEETPQQDGRRRSMEETEYFSDSLQIPERMKELEKELKQEVDPLVKSKSSEVPAAPDVRGEPGSTDQENTDSMETPPPAGPSGSEESSLQTILQNLQKEMETLKNQNAKEMEALKKQKGEEMDTQKSQNAEVRAGHAQEIEALKKQNTEPLKEVAEQTQKGALPVKSRSRDVSVPTNSKGEVRSMDHRDTFSKKVPVMAGGLPVRDESEDKAPASWKKFFIILAGITNGAHQSVVRTFKSVGQTEARSPEDADYCLVFCPISSRVGVNVHEAMNHLLTGKAVVLVVMHHTFNPEQVIPPSRRLVTDPRVRLTLDCLFHQNKLLSCQLNKNMEKNVMEFFRAFTSKTHQSDQGVVEGFKNSFFNWITPENFKEMVHDVAELKQQVDFLVKAQSSDGPVPADREGEPGSMDQENDTDNMELQTPQQDGLKRLREEIENFSCSWQIPKRMKKLENDVAELKQEVDPLVKAKSNEVPAAPDVRGEPGSTDQENTDSMETSPPAGPSGSQDISLQKILQGLLGEMEALKNQTAKEKHHLKNQMEALKNQNTELQKEVAKLKQQVGFPAKSQSSDGSDPAESDGAPQRHVCSWNSELQQHGDSLS